MAVIKLWAIESSPPCWAVRMVADILGLQLDIKNIDFGAKEHKSPEILKLNPMGTVPIIQDGDFVISESHTIIKYLLEKYGKQVKENLHPVENLNPSDSHHHTIIKYLLEKYGKQVNKKLYPSDIQARALVDQALYFDTGVVFIRIKIIALPALFNGALGISPEVAQQVDDVYGIVNAYLEKSTFIAGNQLTIADITTGSSVLALNGLYTIDASRYPRVVSWLDRLKQEPYFSKIAVPGSKILSQFINGCWEQNNQK